MTHKKEYRSTLFNYLDGIAILPSINALIDKGVFELILKNKKISFIDICNNLNLNDETGYLNVAFRLCHSQGWIEKTNFIDGKNYSISLSSEGEELLCHSFLIKQFSTILFAMQNLNKSLQIPFEFNSELILTTLLSVKNQRIKNIFLSSVIGPLFVENGMNNLDLINSKKTSIDFKEHLISEDWKAFISEIFYMSNIINSSQNPELTEFGKFITKRASAFGVTVSYLPLLNKANELIFENPNLAHERSISGEELHVNRKMNVWGSGGAHKVYFKKIDEIVKHIFNKPLDEQPYGIADMGCGNGEFLKHLYNVVKNETIRGQNLNEFPLLIIGADFNEAALESSRITLDNAHIQHYLVKGNIGDPQEFADNLMKDNIDLCSCLNVRSFLDHNRLLDFPIITDPRLNAVNVKGSFSYKGKWVSGNEVLSDFVNHIQKWKPFIQKYGIILLELHTINSFEAQKTLGKNASTAYDATHGYSDQYIIDFNSFKFGIEFTGLTIDERNSIQFPNSQNPSISISYIS